MQKTVNTAKALLSAALVVGAWAAINPAGAEQIYRTLLQTGQTIQQKLS